MSLDHYVTLGRSGLCVSPLCLGAMTFGEEWGFGADAAKSIEMLDHYMDQGGNFIDSANIYSAGHSERILGDHFGRDPAKRQRAVIATKFGGNMQPRDPNGGGARRKSVIAACEASLKRLQTDYIDLYWQHWDDPFTPIEEVMRALGSEVTWHDTAITTRTPEIINTVVPMELGRKNRLAVLTVGPLLHRTGRAVIPVPGGDRIGPRPINFHLAGLQQMGATI